MSGIFRQEVVSDFSVIALIYSFNGIFHISYRIQLFFVYWIATEKAIQVHLRQYIQEWTKKNLWKTAFNAIVSSS